MLGPESEIAHWAKQLGPQRVVARAFCPMSDFAFWGLAYTLFSTVDAQFLESGNPNSNSPKSECLNGHLPEGQFPEFP